MRAEPSAWNVTAPTVQGFPTGWLLTRGPADRPSALVVIPGGGRRELLLQHDVTVRGIGRSDAVTWRHSYTGTASHRERKTPKNRTNRHYAEYAAHTPSQTPFGFPQRPRLLRTIPAGGAQVTGAQVTGHSPGAETAVLTDRGFVRPHDHSASGPFGEGPQKGRSGPFTAHPPLDVASPVLLRHCSPDPNPMASGTCLPTAYGRRLQSSAPNEAGSGAHFKI